MIQGVSTIPGFVLWVLCNPSTASASVDDATERRGWAFTDLWGYEEMRFINTNPYRSTEPKLARYPDEPVLLDNDRYLRYHARRAALIICAWGTNANPRLAGRAESILRVAAGPNRLYTLGLTMNGTPKHPLYLSYKSCPTLWNGLQ